MRQLSIIIMIILLAKVNRIVVNSTKSNNITLADERLSQLDEASNTTAQFIQTIFEFKEDEITMFGSYLTEFASSIGPVFNIFSSALSLFFSSPEEKWQKNVNEQFQQLHERFNQIELKLANVIRLIKTEVFNALYEEKRQHISDVRYAFATYFANPSLTNLANARLACNSESTNPMTIIRHFYDRIVMGIPAAGQLSFTDMLIQTVIEYDYRLSKRWAGQVFSDVLETGILRARCLSLETDEHFNQRQRKIDAEEVTNMTREIGEKLDHMLVMAMTNFSDKQLEKDVRRNVTANQPREEILRHTFDLVVNKYAYFDWYVFVWESNEYLIWPKENHYGIRHILLNPSTGKSVVLIWKTKKYAANPELRKALEKLKDKDHRQLMLTPACIQYL
jgi:hypothetical protein